MPLHVYLIFVRGGGKEHLGTIQETKTAYHVMVQDLLKQNSHCSFGPSLDSDTL